MQLEVFKLNAKSEFSAKHHQEIDQLSTPY